jgi:hypothetical protein
LSFKLTFCCRQLIFSEPEVIASPASGEDDVVYVIVTNDYYKTGKLQLHMEKLNMTVSVFAIGSTLVGEPQCVNIMCSLK